MRERLTLLLLLLSLMTIAGAQTAAAESEDFEFILGGDAPVSTSRAYDQPRGARVDNIDFSWSFYGGVRYRWLGASAGRIDFREPRIRGIGLRDRIDPRGETLSGHHFIPLTHRLILSSELGALFWKQRGDYRDQYREFDADRNDASLLLGLGAGYRFTPDSSITATLRYNHFFDVGDARRAGHESDIDRIAVGFLFVF
jgi:hypothetical protein